MQVWISKYALTSGIFSATAHKVPTNNMVSLKRTPSGMIEFFYGNDWHTDLESAIKQAEIMRTKKIASLNKQILKLKNKTFS